MTFLQKLFSTKYAWLVGLPAIVKRVLLSVADIVLVILAYLGSVLFVEGRLDHHDLFTPILVLMLLTAFSSALMGMHRIKLFGFDLASVRSLAATVALIGLAAGLLSLLGLLETNISVAVLFSILYFLMSVGLRVGLLHGLTLLQAKPANRVPVAIYGAGSAGVQLVVALKHSNEFKPVALVDDKPSLQGLVVSNLRIQQPSALEDLASSGQIVRILLAMPSLSADSRKLIAKKLSKLGCEIQTLPSYPELISGERLFGNWKPVSPETFLDREDINLGLVGPRDHYKSKVVMVTGAGGSIGSELCRQLMSYEPSCIVLFEQSEFALYSIEKSLQELFPDTSTKICAVLGSVIDRARVEEVITGFKVKAIFHAAAYKHVPLVEQNEIEGIRNNVLGTQILCSASVRLKVEGFTLISSDKAVRPTNIMGATKRLAELIVQNSQAIESSTIFASVRFGNVLGSSGSVIPLFESQIATGGPVTITDRRVTRYFMTLSEAAQLVLVAGSYARGGDVFVLDMGEPIKIVDLATRMIELLGKSVKRDNSDGFGIEIKEIGLRAGEKLYEELLIDHKTLSTPHNKILRAEETTLPPDEVELMLNELHSIVESSNHKEARKFIKKWVKEFNPEN